MRSSELLRGSQEHYFSRNPATYTLLRCTYLAWLSQGLMLNADTLGIAWFDKFDSG